MQPKYIDNILGVVRPKHYLFFLFRLIEVTRYHLSDGLCSLYVSELANLRSGSNIQFLFILFICKDLECVTYKILQNFIGDTDYYHLDLFQLGFRSVFGMFSQCL